MIEQCILTHRGSVNVEKTSPEKICVASADAMAHIDQVASLFYYVYNEKKLSIDDGRIWIKEKLERSWNKLCPQAKEIIKDKYFCVLKILE